MDTYIKYISGGLSGITEVLITYPLDMIKTKKQFHSQKKIKEPFLTYLKKDKNYYRGITPRIIGIIPLRFLFWGVQDNTNHYLKNKEYNKIQKGLIVGFNCGVSQTIIDNPIENIKILQIANKKIDLKKVLKNNYGFTATLYRNTFFAMSMGTICMQNRTDSNIKNFFLASTAGVFGTIISQPLDYCKTEKQRNYNLNKVSKILIDAFKENPLKLYSGLLNRSLLNFFSMGIGFVVYDNYYYYLSKFL